MRVPAYLTALNEALTAEVQRLKIATAELNGDSRPSNNLIPQLSFNPQMFQLQQQQHPPSSSQLNIHLQQQQQRQNGSTTTKAESKE
ncbi:hypothetical protein L6164_037577 [Bauhinia variegata]|uniref:Uncharacterized protein n=1 Tax=Bauhinia variegata TaxID=167791 RepID=A0ACB9KKA9_BAUVA|nr:hypothetical protein L6164_037577 [Bauhinia variegata]